MPAASHRLTLLGICLALAGCGGGGGGDGDTGGDATAESPIRIAAVTVAGTSVIPCTVSVNGIADADRRRDAVWSATVPADGTSLPAYTDGIPYSAVVTTTVVETSPARTAFTIDIDP